MVFDVFGGPETQGDERIRVNVMMSSLTGRMTILTEWYQGKNSLEDIGFRHVEL